MPTEKAKSVQRENRRLGTGLMGFHEFLLRRNSPYEMTDELRKYLQVWKDTSNQSAKDWASKLGFPEPIAKRAIAPNGTTSIAGGRTTSGLEPIFSVAYQRRYLTPDGWKKQYVIDPVAEKLAEEGLDPSKFEDAYSLSKDVERRIAFQAGVQEYVDNSISSTINLPAFGEDGNNDLDKFGKTLYNYLPKLRGITVYPDGARGGQPITSVPYEFAINKKDIVFEGNENCSEGVCGL